MSARVPMPAKSMVWCMVGERSKGADADFSIKVKSPTFTVTPKIDDTIGDSEQCH